MKVHSRYTEQIGLHTLQNDSKWTSSSFVHNQHLNYLVAITTRIAEVKNHNCWWLLCVNWPLSCCLGSQTKHKFPLPGRWFSTFTLPQQVKEEAWDSQLAPKHGLRTTEDENELRWDLYYVQGQVTFASLISAMHLTQFVFQNTFRL